MTLQTVNITPKRPSLFKGFHFFNIFSQMYMCGITLVYIFFQVYLCTYFGLFLIGFYSIFYNIIYENLEY